MMTSSTASASELGDLAVAWAREAGEMVLDMREDAIADVDTKSSVADVVTAGDKAAEKLITDAIDSARPDDAILGEEGADKSGTSGLRWIIDPIDGTTNYLYGLPGYTVSIAVEDAGEMLAGAVYDPGNDLMFSAARGEGAFLNGQLIHCSAKNEMATALVATGFGYSADRRKGQADVLVEILPQVRDIRRSGSAALDLCLVASGSVDAYYERGLNPWDLAAGWLIASEAGATVQDLRGNNPSAEFVLASGPELFALLGEQLRNAEADQRF
jgi:myo-inositol-1(or 4)-monophosphatase